MSGGIWVFWQKSRFTMTILQAAPQFIHINVSQPDGVEWLLTVVYRNPNGRGHESFQGEIEDIACSVNKPWLMVGDFNSIVSMSECSRGGGKQSARVKFSNWLKLLGMIDMGFSGTPYTWAR